MWPLRTLIAVKPDALALEAKAEHAGCALACSFSSSSEYEASIIRARRAAGVYGPRRQRRQAAGVVAALALVALLICLI